MFVICFARAAAERICYARGGVCSDELEVQAFSFAAVGCALLHLIFFVSRHGGVLL